MIIYDIAQIDDVKDIYNLYYENNKLRDNLLNDFKKNQSKIIDRMLQIIINKCELNNLRFVFIVAKQLVVNEDIINITI